MKNTISLLKLGWKYFFYYSMVIFKIVLIGENLLKIIISVNFFIKNKIVNFIALNELK
jgi:hypothetical protein